MKMPPPHAHYFGTITGQRQGHRHRLELFTYPVNGDGNDGHIHWFQGTTDRNEGHFHRLIGTTGPAVSLAGGGHVHYLDSETDPEPFTFQGGFYRTVVAIPRHAHPFTGYTSPPIGCEPEGW